MSRICFEHPSAFGIVLVYLDVVAGSTRVPTGNKHSAVCALGGRIAQGRVPCSSSCCTTTKLTPRRTYKYNCSLPVPCLGVVFLASSQQHNPRRTTFLAPLAILQKGPGAQGPPSLAEVARSPRGPRNKRVRPVCAHGPLRH